MPEREPEFFSTLPPRSGDWSRRRFLAASGTAGASALTVPYLHAAVHRPVDVPNADSGPAPTALRTEHLTDPLALGTKQPRLSWIAGQSTQGRQTAYQVVVGRSVQEVRAGRGSVWDSGQVSSDQSVDIVYGGAGLRAGQRYYWGVRTWDQGGTASPWSTPAWFETGPLDDADWVGAAWIQAPDTGRPSLDQSHWIWYPEGSPGQYFPAEVRYFRRAFTVTDAAAVTEAVAVMTADDYFDLYINGTLAGSRPNVTNGWQQAQLYDITSRLVTGTNVVAVAATNANADTPAGLLGVLQLTTGSGTTTIPTDTTWRSAQSVPNGWQATGFDDSSWNASMDEGRYGTGVWGQNVQVTGGAPAPYLRTEFTLSTAIASARLYVCGLGYYMAWLNGQRVGDHELDPAPSVYDSTTLYSSYDVTQQLRPGRNALGVVLGRSFYAIDSPNIYWIYASWIADRPAALLCLQVTHPDGSQTTVVSDGSWMTHPGPTRSDSVYNGEVFDAREVQPRWDQPGGASGWSTAQIDTSARLPATRRPQLMPPVRVVQTLQATSVTKLPSGSYIFQFPRMLAGRPKLRVRAPAGTVIDLRYGEIRNSDGTVDNQGDPGITPGEIQHDSYTTAGTGLETWTPSFSYGSFQYVQLDGYPGTPPADAVTAQVLHTDVAPAGGFNCSDDLVNAIHRMTCNTILNNFTGIPTDTPMYEKRGWFGDASLYCTPSADNFDVQTFWTNFLAVMADDQGANGNFGDLAPAIARGLGADPTWSTAGLVIPWMLYQEYGDIGVLATHYASMKAFVDYLTGAAHGSIVDGTYGDWCAPGYVAPPEGAQLTSTASYYRSASLLSQIAEVLGNEADRANYAALASRIRDAFNAAFLDTNAGIYRTGVTTAYRQSSNAYPLFLGMVPESSREAVTANLVKHITSNGNHLDTGIVGTMALFPALTEAGYVDLAYQVVTQRTYPGYGYWQSLGATTLWEQWIATPRSHDHAMFGSVDDWFYKYLAGIRPAAPGYRKITIRPYLPSGLTSVSCYRDTPYGRVSADWHQSPDGYQLNVSVPPNTTATVALPVTSGSRVRTNAPQAAGPVDPGRAQYRVDPGTHSFTVQV